MDNVPVDNFFISSFPHRTKQMDLWLDWAAVWWMFENLHASLMVYLWDSWMRWMTTVC